MKKLIFVLLLSLPLFTYSQSINDAGVAFNQGIEAAKLGNLDGAIENYLLCIDICEQLGLEGDELKQKASTQIAKQFLNSGINSYKNKDYNEAIRKFEESSKFAGKVGDAETKAKADNYLAIFYASFGMSSWKKDDFEKAMDYFDKSLAIDPANTKALLGAGLVYKSQSNEAEMKKAIDKCIATGPADDKYVQQAKSLAYKYYLAKGGKELQAGNYNTAIEKFNASMEYGKPTGETYYYMAVAFNGSSDFDKAIEAAENGLAAGDGDASNLNFEMARAYEGKGENTSACEAYKKVISGPNLDAAKHKVVVELKCN